MRRLYRAVFCGGYEFQKEFSSWNFLVPREERGQRDKKRGDDQLVWPSPLTLMGMSCLEVWVDLIDECLADPLDEVSLA